MTRSLKFVYNTAASAVYQVIVILVGIVLPRVILVNYGSEINGLVTSVTQFISYFTLVEAGLSSATVYALYKPLADNDNHAISRIVTASKKFYFQSGFIFLGLVVLLSWIYPLLISVSSLSKVAVGLLIIVLGASGIIDFFTLAKYRSILTADQRSYIISIASIIYLILNTIIIAIMAYNKTNIVVVRFVAIGSIFVRSVILVVYTRLKYPKIKYNVEPDFDALNKRWDAMNLQVLGVVQKGTPTLLATIFTSLNTVSIFSIYNMVLAGISSLFDIFMSGLASGFGEIIAKKEVEVLKKTYGEFEFAYYAMITVVYVTALIMIMPFVSIYTKNITDADYYQPLIGFLFVLNGFLYNIKTPQGMLVMSAGLYKETRVQTLIQTVIVIVVGVILTPLWGLAGILIALCVSNLYRDIDLILYITKKVIGLPIISTVSKVLYSILSAAISVLILRCFHFNPTGYAQWMLQSIVVFSIATGVYLMISFLFMRPYLKAVIQRIVILCSGRKYHP